jgi:hypothetical protein
MFDQPFYEPCIFDNIYTEKQYHRRLRLKGRDRIRSARAWRERTREKLKIGGLDELARNARILQDSSSEEDTDDEVVDLPAIDWGQAQWGNEVSLWKHMSTSEISSLVGWATHLKDDNACRQNALLDMPNTPLPISILNFIKEHAVSSKIHYSGEVSWQTKDFVAIDGPAKQYRNKQQPERWSKRRRLPKHKESWDYGSDDETYRWTKENFIPTEFVQVTVPVHLRQARKKVKTQAIPLDVSAQVALGVVIEEVLIGSFMSMARQHVARCRRKEADAFDDWTMPPEEAILACDSTPPLPSAITVQGKTEPSHVAKWCKSRGLEVTFVQSNMDIYAKLLPCPPLVIDGVKQESLQVRQRTMLKNLRESRGKRA